MPARYSAANSATDAVHRLSAAGTRPLGGGTDLLGAMEAGLDAANTLVDLTRASDLAAITPLPDGGWCLGGAARLDDVVAHPELRAALPLVVDATNTVGTAALRAMGTVAGNLAQRLRCWYVRSRIRCLKNGGSGCPAVDGENQYHAILGEGMCRAAHPSDLAVALLALDAVVVARGAEGERRLTIAELYADAATDPRRETVLADREIIVRVEIPATACRGEQRFAKLMQRGQWDFATVSLAGAKRTDGSVRLVLGGVAAGPWRVNESVEEDVASGALDEESAEALAARALYDASPLSGNGYKVQQAATLLRRAMLDLSRA